MLTGTHRHLVKGNAIVACAEALRDLQSQPREDRGATLDAALESVHAALEELGEDPDLLEIEGLLQIYRAGY